MTLYVGLGNPGPAYERTRHNIGWRVVDALVERTGAREISKKSFHGELYRRGELFFLKPLTFMNRSGRSVQAVMNFFKISLDDLVVIHDDLDLPFGALRLKKGGGSGGHNGLRSIDEAVGREYLRVRMGIGKPAMKSQVADYVLHPFGPEEEERIAPWVEYASQLCLKIPRMPLEELKSRYTLKGIEALP